MEQLKELMLLEEIKHCLPDSIVIHVNEQKVSTIAQASLLMDEFMLMYKTIFLAEKGALHKDKKKDGRQNTGSGPTRRVGWSSQKPLS